MDRTLENKLSFTTSSEPTVKSNKSNAEGLISDIGERYSFQTILKDVKSTQHLTESIRNSLSATTVCLFSSPYMPVMTKNKKIKYNADFVSYSGDSILLPIGDEYLSKWLEKCRESDSNCTHTLTRGCSNFILPIKGCRPYAMYHQQSNLQCLLTDHGHNFRG